MSLNLNDGHPELLIAGIPRLIANGQKLSDAKLEGAALRVGDWKLISTEGLPIMLYNLTDDLN